MKKLFATILTLQLCIAAFSQQNFPFDLKGNWLNAADSIEWLYSFQPGFAVCETQFWEYKSITRQGNEYNLHLVNGKENKLLSVKLIDSTSLQITVQGKTPTLCTNQKARKPNFRNYDTLEFKEPILVDDTATIIGFIEDYDPEIFSKTGSVEYYSFFSGAEDDSKTEFQIQPDGRFSLKFRMFNPQNIWFSIDGSTQTTCFAKPGETLMICFNKLLRDVTVDDRKWKVINDWQINHYMGKTGLLSEELILLQKYFYYSVIPVQERLTSREVMQQLKYQSWRKQVYEKEIYGLDSLENAMNCSAKARQVMSKTALFQNLEDLLEYPFKNPASFQLSQKYIDRLPAIESSSELNILTSEYKYYINYLGFYFRVQIVGGIYVDRYIENMNYYAKFVTDPDDLKIISDWTNFYSVYTWPEFMDRDELTDRVNDSLLMQRNNNFYNTMMSIANKYEGMAPTRNFAELWVKEFDFVMHKFNSDLTGQIYAAYHMLLLQHSGGFDPIVIDWAKQNITNPLLINYLLETRKEKEEIKLKYDEYAAGTHFIDSIASDKNSDAFFSEILKRFEGKVVYIDFWADWCSPCRAEFEPAAKLKQEYAGKDIVFLYFGISCRKNLWENMIKEKQVEGYHFWLNKDQGDVMYKKFNFKGIPYFVLIDKNGKIQEGEAPRPSSKIAVRERLDELLK
jgi:thiol-disulfide isomerase/thioredoxin